jgi:hypothetical protein
MGVSQGWERVRAKVQNAHESSIASGAGLAAIGEVWVGETWRAADLVSGLEIQMQNQNRTWLCAVEYWVAGLRHHNDTITRIRSYQSDHRALATALDRGVVRHAHDGVCDGQRPDQRSIGGPGNAIWQGMAQVPVPS